MRDEVRTEGVSDLHGDRCFGLGNDLDALDLRFAFDRFDRRDESTPDALSGVPQDHVVEFPRVVGAT